MEKFERGFQLRNSYDGTGWPTKDRKKPGRNKPSEMK
jgi:hypothetical protein